MTSQFHHLPSLIFKINIIFLLSYLAASGELSYDNSNIVLLAQESYTASLLPVAQKLNTIFEIANPPAYVTLVNSLQAAQTLTFQNAFQNSTASFINSTFVAFIDATFNFSYGTYDLTSQTDVLNSVNLTQQSTNSTCSSMASLREYIIIVCEEYDQSQLKQIQTLYYFDTNTAKFETNVQDLPYQSVQDKLDATVLAFHTPNGPLVITYYNKTSSGQDQTNWIYVTNLQSGQGNFVNLANLGFPESAFINRVEMNYQGIYLITDQGSVYFSQYTDDPMTLGNFRSICTIEKQILWSSIKSQNLALMTQTRLYYIQGSIIPRTFQIPLGFSPLFCSLDNKFAYVVAVDTIDSVTYTLVYDLNNPNNPNHFLAQKISSTTQVLGVSQPETTGNFILLSGDQIYALKINEPKLVLTQVTESAVFNITTNNNPQDFVSINISVISDPTQVFQLNQTLPPISGINSPSIQVLNTFVGPSVGLLESDMKTFSQSVYGPCQINNLSIPADPSFLSIKIVPSSSSLINNQIAANVSFVQDSTITYTSLILDNLYSSQCLSSVSKLLNQTKYNLAANPSKCLFGKSYDICLVNQLFVHINPIQGVIFISTQQCQDIYLWSRSTEDVSVCINNDQILIYNKSGQNIESFTAAQINIPSFTSLRITSNDKNLLVIAYEKGIIGLNLLESQSPKVVFSISVNLNTEAFLQLASNKIILAQLNDNIIGEWDISDLENPYFVKNYPLFSFKLDSTIQPFYQEKPNHLGFHAYDQNQLPYLLTFQPGNLANSVLIYATKLDADSKMMAFAFDDIFKYNVFFSLGSETTHYLYLAESPIISLPTNQSDETCSSLYCTENSLFQITSNLNLQQQKTPFNLTYTTIYAEKIIAPIDLSSLGEPTIRSDIPLVGLPRDVSGGTPLEYNLTNLTLKVSGKIENVLYFRTPLDLFQTLSTSVSSDPLTTNNQLRLFGEGKTLYALDEVGLFSLDTTQNPLRLTNIKLPSLPPNVTLIDGHYDYYSGSVALIYKGSDAWGVYVHPDGLNFGLKTPVSKVKVINNLVFILAQGGGVDLVYLLDQKDKHVNLFETVKSVNFPNSITPKDFNVEKLADGIFSLLIVDGTDSIYNLIFNQTALTVKAQKIDKITQFVAADLPPSDLQIVGIQTTKNDQNSLVSYALFVKNFHSYQIQLKYQTDQSIIVQDILTCFVQMPGHKSTGNAVMTDSFFFDLKEKFGIYYLYSYPLNSTYPGSDDSNGYDYIQPVQRRQIADSVNANKIQIYAADGITTTAFVGVRSQNGINIPQIPWKYHNSSSKEHIRKIRQLQEYPQDMNSQIQILVYNASYTLEVGFNPDLWSTDLADVEADKVYLGMANDISSGNLEINLDKPLNLLNSTYFIIFTIIFTLLFCITCAWFFRRAYKKRNVSLDRGSISYHGLEDDFIQKEKPKRRSTKKENTQ